MPSDWDRDAGEVYGAEEVFDVRSARAGGGGFGARLKSPLDPPLVLVTASYTLLLVSDQMSIAS
jgi:hypothetical protein